MDRLLLDNPYFRITIDDHAKLVRVKRTATQYPSIDEVKKTNATRNGALEHLRGKGYALLLDARDGPLRNDPAFEQETMTTRVLMFEMFAKVAIVVKTAVGELQMNRLSRDDRAKPTVPTKVFHDDEAAALAFLQAT